MNFPEKPRRQVVRLVFLIYLLLIFEGSFRKWLLPGLQEYIFFVRDPFLILIYVICLGKGLKLPDRLFSFFWLLSCTGLVLVFIQFLFTDANALVLAYGLRNYFFYVPLSFIIARVFKKKDFIAFTKLSAWLCVLLFPLICIQYISGPDAFINKQVGDGIVFTVNEDIVRTTGTFSFSAGEALFAAASFAMALATVFSAALRKEFSLILLLSFLITSVGTVLMSGSRGAYLHCGFILAAVLTFNILKGRGSLRVRIAKLCAAILLAVIFAASVAVFVPQVITAMIERNEVATEVEGSPILRSFSQFTDFIDQIPKADLIGAGVGIGTTGGSYLQTGSEQLTVAEIEWSRIVLEGGPIFGLLYIVFRVALFVRISTPLTSLQRTKADAISISLWGFTTLVLLVGQVTHQGTVNAFCWIFLGLTMGSSRTLTTSSGLRK